MQAGDGSPSQARRLNQSIVLTPPLAAETVASNEADDAQLKRTRMLQSHYPRRWKMALLTKLNCTILLEVEYAKILHRALFVVWRAISTLVRN
jgi:hypothetical protein